MLPSFTGDISASSLPKEMPISSQGYILTVGRLVPEKGFHDLVTAYKASNSHLKLVIVGQADHQDEYASTLVKQASDSIIFAGRRSGDELKALYKHARVFVLPSYHEGLPIVALEAISAGTPVILSDILPNKDIEAPVDSYFEVGNISDLAEKISHVDSLDLALDQEKFLYNFNWDRIAEKSSTLVKDIAEKGSSL